MCARVGDRGRVSSRVWSGYSRVRTASGSGADTAANLVPICLSILVTVARVESYVKYEGRAWLEYMTFGYVKAIELWHLQRLGLVESCDGSGGEVDKGWHYVGSII